MALIETERNKKILEALEEMEIEQELNNNDICTIWKIMEIGQFRKRGIKDEEIKSHFLNLLNEYIYEINQEVEITLDEIIEYIKKEKLKQVRKDYKLNYPFLDL